MFYLENVDLAQIETIRLCEATLSQSNTTLWFSARKVRITASVAHKIFRARKEETRLKYFVNNSKGGDLNVESLKYGREMEPAAFEKYKEVTKNQVFKSGMIVSCDKSYLGASPDGLVKCDDGEWIILEIKCPVSCRDKPIEVPYLERGLRGLELKKTHEYFTQCQVLMYVCKLKKTHFFVYSSNDYKLVTVDYDKDFT